MTLDDYILTHTSPEPDYLYRLWRATNIHTIHGRMASGHLQGRLLKMLVEMIRPKNVLEVGTFSGYSTTDGSTRSKLTMKSRIFRVRGLKVRRWPTRLRSSSAMP